MQLYCLQYLRYRGDHRGVDLGDAMQLWRRSKHKFRDQEHLIPQLNQSNQVKSVNESVGKDVLLFLR